LDIDVKEVRKKHTRNGTVQLQKNTQSVLRKVPFLFTETKIKNNVKEVFLLELPIVITKNKKKNHHFLNYEL